MKRFFYLLFLGYLVDSGDETAIPKLESELKGAPFDRYVVTDRYQRPITFYLSRPTKDQVRRSQSVILFVQGSGCQSAFQKRGEQIAGGLQNLIWKQAQGRARVMIVEKPGVKFLDAPPRPGSAEGASQEYLREHTFDRWVEANVAALRGAWKLEGIDPKRTLVVGHSEGGIIAAGVAAQASEVTNVASLAGGGPSQLFDLVEFQRKPQPSDQPGDAEARAKAVLADWEQIAADPESTEKQWMGHPYRRWSSFLSHSVVGEMKKSKARLYLAQGSADSAVLPMSHHLAIAELKAAGREVTGDFVLGGDHGFSSAANPEGLPQAIDRVLKWFEEENEARSSAK